MLKPLNVFALIFVVLFAATPNSHSLSVTNVPELNAFFQQTNGWIGADGAYSIQLSKKKSLWLFSDTWIGRVQDGKRIAPQMINNSIAIQEHGKAPQFFYRSNATGKAESFVKPEDGRGFYWLFAGTRTREGLFFFLKQVEIINPNSVFGFRGFNTSMARVKNPDDAPHKWHVEQMKFPFDSRKEKEQVSLGSAVMKDKGFVYIYGNSTSESRKGTIVARVPERHFSAFDKWQFYCDGEWTRSFNAATPICTEAPPEASVSYSVAMKKYLYIYAEGLWGKIVMRTADRPTGPWSSPTLLYQCPEMKYGKKIFCYAGKAHPQLSKDRDELIISYASNSFDLSEVVNDARFYFPRFIRVQF